MNALVEAAALEQTAALTYSLPQTQHWSGIFDQLFSCGWVVTPQLMPVDVLTTLQQEFEQQYQQQAFTKAGIGIQKSIHSRVRGDNIYWLDFMSPAQIQYRQQLDQIEHFLRQEYRCSLQHLSSHYALYPPGTGYQTHYDNPRQNNDRVITLISYLNHDWHADVDGGEIVLYAQDQKTVLKTVTPEFGVSVLLLSQQVPHEVLPCTKNRKSITGWFGNKAI